MSRNKTTWQSMVSSLGIFRIKELVETYHTMTINERGLVDYLTMIIKYECLIVLASIYK
jgi:hypothetical protein